LCGGWVGCWVWWGGEGGAVQEIGEVFEDWEVFALGLSHRDGEDLGGLGWGEGDECLIRVVSSGLRAGVGRFGWLCGVVELFASIRPSHPPARVV